MFQLIVAVVGIALVVILSVLALWVGGTAFTSSNEKALFTTYFNQGTQIEGALKLYAANNGGVSMSVSGEDGTPEATQEALDILVNSHYLTTAPDPEAWIIEGTSIYRALDSSDGDQCKRLNEFAGKDTSLAPNGCPACDDDAFNGWPGCTRDAG